MFLIIKILLTRNPWRITQMSSTMGQLGKIQPANIDLGVHFDRNRSLRFLDLVIRRPNLSGRECLRKSWLMIKKSKRKGVH